MRERTLPITTYRDLSTIASVLVAANHLCFLRRKAKLPYGQGCFTNLL